MPVPVTLSKTAPASGVCALDDWQAVLVDPPPTVSENVVVRDVPVTDAVITMFPGVEPSVTFVFACPVESVVVDVGVTVAEPVVTAKATVAPFTAVPFEAATFTVSGVVSVCPTSPTCPLPDTTLTAAAGGAAPGPEGLSHAAAIAAATRHNAPRMRDVLIEPPSKSVSR